MKAALILFAALISANFAPGEAQAAPEPRDSSVLSAEELEVARSFDLGGIRGLRVLAQPRDFREATFNDENGEELDLSAFEGKVVLVNLWGTWCAPCVREMPSLDRLNAALGGEDFGVVVVNFEPGGREAAKARRFFNRAGITSLPIYTDHSMALSRIMGVTGRPVSAILGRDGREIARLVGDAEWDSETALGFIRHMIEATRD